MKCVGNMWLGVLALLGLSLWMVGCSSTPEATTSVALPEVFPVSGAVPGWEAVGEVEMYSHDTLFDLVNGQADAFFVYGFERVAVRSYENAAGVIVRVEIWELATAADAYGLFSTVTRGEPVTLGHTDAAEPNADMDPGRRVGFWQSHYYVHVGARGEIPNADLEAFATAIADALPMGGEVPAPVGRLPETGRVPRSTLFFHEEISIQDVLWLGGENVLGLSQATNGVLARYDIGGAEALLLLVQYPEADTAAAALTALQGADVADLVTADVEGSLLRAIFGPVDPAAAAALLEKCGRQ